MTSTVSPAGILLGPESDEVDPGIVISKMIKDLCLFNNCIIILFQLTSIYIAIYSTSKVK